MCRGARRRGRRIGVVAVAGPEGWRPGTGDLRHERDLRRMRLRRGATRRGTGRPGRRQPGAHRRADDHERLPRRRSGRAVAGHPGSRTLAGWAPGHRRAHRRRHQLGRAQDRRRSGARPDPGHRHGPRRPRPWLGGRHLGPGCHRRRRPGAGVARSRGAARPRRTTSGTHPCSAGHR